MLEFIVVESGHFYPQCCVSCGSYKGPLADTHMETHSGRVYVCRACARRLAILFGFAKGEQMDRLSQAADRLTLSEQQIDEALCRITELEAEKDETLRKLDELQNYRVFADGRIAQLEAAIGEDAKVKLALVEGK